MAPYWTDKYGTKYDHPPSNQEIATNRFKNLQIPTILIHNKTNTDPCIDDLDQKTDNLPGNIEKIIIGLVIGLILFGVLK